VLEVSIRAQWACPLEAHIQTAHHQQATPEYSRGMTPDRSPRWSRDRSRTPVVATALAGAAALAAATPATPIQITVGTTTNLARVDIELSGWRRSVATHWRARNRASERT
jgi:hypothetical protein